MPRFIERARPYQLFRLVLAIGIFCLISACNGGASQNWNIGAVPQSGAFTIAAAVTGRCMHARNASTSAGTVLEVADCLAGSTSQQFNVQAM